MIILRNLIYSCVFFNENYINLLNLLLKSYKFFGNPSNNIDYLIICNPDFKSRIQEIFNNLNIQCKIWCLDLKTKFEAGYSRLKIFEYPNINLYKKILYLDCDILITGPINKVLNIKLEKKIYSLKEGNTNHLFWGEQFFENNPNCPAFTTGILLFKNNIIIKDLFSKILIHISNHLNKNLPIPGCLDQPFIVFHAVENNLYDNTRLIDLVINNPNMKDEWKPKNMLENFTNQIICHFPGGPGNYENKILKMNNFMNDNMFKIGNNENINQTKLITKSKKPPNKNTIFPLIGLCISYNYIDTLTFMLPINYNHFEKIYLVTQADDVKTIEFCKKFINVEIFLYDFKNNDKTFDKYGALNMIQKIVYEKYPNHWYLIMDSDIILPNNFIDILKQKNLQKDCMYGATRNDINKSSELLMTIYPDYSYRFNSLENLKHFVLGSFQLYFKINIFHDEFNNAGKGDRIFCKNNFNKLCILENLVYLHLGVPGKNWDGKKEYFIDDISININQIYFDCNIKCKNIYYNNNGEVINIEESDTSISNNYNLNGLYKKYTWNKSVIQFLENNKMKVFGQGKYHFIDKYLVKCDFGGREHLLKFNQNYSSFISIRRGDFENIFGYEYIKKPIPKIVLQTSINKPELYIIDIIKKKCPKWKYIHFVDSEILEYFKKNPIQEFPNIIEKFNSFSKGQHKADLFRYYYLYLNGGIFLDSDAIFEVNIYDIIKDYESVFVKSFMPNTHLFNGFIATYPKNLIIYKALKHAYDTDDKMLQKNYHYLCEKLWKIYNIYNPINTKIYQEHNKNHEGYGGSVILNDNKKKIISHYWKSKLIPNLNSYQSPNYLKNKNLIYSCIFFNKSYIKLLKLLLLSYKLYKSEKSNITYLIICNQEFNKDIFKIFNDLSLDFVIWNLNIITEFEAACCRLNIFDFQHINNFEKILYLDCDILINNNIEKIFDLNLENNKLYVSDRCIDKLEGCFGVEKKFSVYDIKIINNLDTSKGFCSGILFFTTGNIIKTFFKDTQELIKNYKGTIPITWDQPFINVEANRRNLINFKLIDSLCLNAGSQGRTSGCLDNLNEVIIHFTEGDRGIAECKFNRMKNYFDNLINKNKISYNFLENRSYSWGNDKFFITFLFDNKMSAFGKGEYYFIDKHLVVANFGEHTHFIKFDDNYSNFISIRQNDYDIVKGNYKQDYKNYNTKYGKVTLLNNDIYFTKEFDEGKYWDEILLCHLKDFYIDKGNILEIGGHSGTSSLFYSNICDNLYVYEPQLKMYNLLCKNIKDNNKQNVNTYNKALFCLNGKIQMNDTDLDGIIKGKIKVLEDKNEKINYGGISIGKDGESIECVTLDSLNMDNIKFIHCDAQGAEPYIFSKGKEFIKKHRPTILYENSNLYGKYLFNVIKKSYPQYNQESEFDVKDYCINTLGGYTYIENFMNSGFDSLLIPYNRTDWNNYNKKEMNEFKTSVLIGYECPNPLIRVGPKSDGGYVIVDGLNYDYFISCGIANDIRFELALLDKYHKLKCYAFDGTINNFPNHNSNINWIKKNIGYINSEKITNLKPYIQNNKNIFLKMDIEGSEFNWIDSMSFEDLKCFSQIVMEIHWPFDKYRYEMLKKLNQTHYIIHIHGNNFCDRDIPKNLPSGRSYDGTVTIKNSNNSTIKIPEVFEITYVRKTNFKDDLNKIKKKYPTSLDSPNNPCADDISFTIKI